MSQKLNKVLGNFVLRILVNFGHSFPLGHLYIVAHWHCTNTKEKGISERKVTKRSLRLKWKCYLNKFNSVKSTLRVSRPKMEEYYERQGIIYKSILYFTV